MPPAELPGAQVSVLTGAEVLRPFRGVLRCPRPGVLPEVLGDQLARAAFDAR